ncbi:carbohydrate sulfotransferase 4-like [Hyperolius riggenbachi]|uniref:carbohydrate sulfotransferase 4-like n=1 Tax=Hyperolius riggenbachi TaxID=752182 RepID=UPI0035A316DB
MKICQRKFSFLVVATSVLGLMYFKLHFYPSTLPSIPKHTHILILSSWRSGSSFTGQLFSQHPDVFYLMEPAWHVWATMGQNSLKILHMVIRDLVRSLFLCDMSVYDAYLPEQRTKSTLFQWETSRALCSPPACDFFNRHDIIPQISCRTLCRKYPFDAIEKACKSYSHIVLKEVRFFDLKVLYPLLQDPSLNLKILHLVRDPRAVFQSRKMVTSELSFDDNILIGANSNQKPYKVMQVICKSQAEIYNTGTKDIPSDLHKRYMMVRYEDIVKDPVGKAKEMYQFANLHVTPKLEGWVYNITHGNKGRGHGFVISARNAINISRAWRTALPFEDVRKVQDICLEAMAMFGYRLLKNENEQKNVFLDLVLPIPKRDRPDQTTT